MSTITVTGAVSVSTYKTNEYYLKSGAVLNITSIGNAVGTVSSKSPPDITWDQENTSGSANGVAINNSGLLLATGKNRVFDTTDAAVATESASNFTLVNATTGTIIAGSDVMRDRYVNAGGSIVISNAGLIQASTMAGADGRAFNFQQDVAVTLSSGSVVSSFSLLSINNSGIIASYDDVIRVTNQKPAANGVSGVYNPLFTGNIFITNTGTILSEGSLSNAGTSGVGAGQGIDLADVNAQPGHVVITNGTALNSTALIESTDNDAIRPGNNGIVLNYGTIDGAQIFTSANYSTPTKQGGNDGVSATYDELITVTNYGLIEGSKSGVYGERDPATETLSSDSALPDGTPTLSSDIIVVNEQTGTIVGEDGKGVGADFGNIYNAGTIIGEDNPNLLRGDGDGIDVNFTVYVTNAAGGVIEALGSEGSDDNGRINVADGLAIGGGTVYNAGTIYSANNGVTVNNDGNPDGSRSGNADLVLTNAVTGIIVAEDGYAIRSENKAGTDESNLPAVDYDTVVNYGTIISYGTIPDLAGTFEITTYGATVSGDITTYGTTFTPDPNVVGTIEGQVYTSADAGSIRFTKGDGSAIQLGEGDDILTDYGTIIATDGKAINLEGGNNTLNLYAGADISGIIDGGLGGTNRLNLFTPDGAGADGSATAGTLDNIIDFQTLDVSAGTWTLEDAETYSSYISVASGASLVLGATGSLLASTLEIGGGGSVAGTLALGLGEKIILDNFSAASDSYNGTALNLTGASGNVTLNISGATHASDFLVTTLNGNTTISQDNFGSVTASGTTAQTISSGDTVASVTLAGGILTVASGGTISGGISFSGTDGTLVLESGTAPANTISGFGAGDTIVLAGVPYGAAGDHFTVATAGTLTVDAGGHDYKFLIAGAYVGDTNFVISGDFSITGEPPCYAEGTRIATAAGAVNVEDLAIGDMVETLHAGLQKIKWIGRRSYDGRFIAGNKDILPIRIAAGAIAENVPARDLFVSPGHAICIDGALIHAFRLVNGVSITQAASVESLTYYHIETANHEVIFAENCPAETFIDENFRAQFQNASQFRALYPGQSAAGIACLPRLEDGFLLHAIQRRLNARAGILPPSAMHGALRGYVDEPGPAICSGWAQDADNPETPVCLDIVLGGTRVARVLANLYRADLRQAGLGSGCHAFRASLPAGVTGQLEVRRAADGAELAWTDAALAEAA